MGRTQRAGVAIVTNLWCPAQCLPLCSRNSPESCGDTTHKLTPPLARQAVGLGARPCICSWGRGLGCWAGGTPQRWEKGRAKGRVTQALLGAAGLLDPAMPEGDTPSADCQVHALWSQGLHAPFSTCGVNSRLSGQAWTPPLSIRASQAGATVRMLHR